MREHWVRSLRSVCLSAAIHICGLLVLHVFLIPRVPVTSHVVVVVPTDMPKAGVSESLVIELPQLELPMEQDHVASDRVSLTVPGVTIDNPFSVTIGEPDDHGHRTIEFGIGFQDGLASKLVQPFGIDVRSERLLFLVDGSRSMEIDDRRSVAFDEVLSAVRRISLRQQFGVILFGDERNPPLFRNELVVALPDAYADLASWLHSGEYSESTFLAEAARQALELKPDVIVLVTDGKYCDARAVHDVWRTAPEDLIIHTVNIGTQDGAVLLRWTAKSHHGEYRYVEAREPAEVASALVNY